MSVNEKIINALKGFGMPVEPDVYNGSEKEYFTFTYVSDGATEFADDSPSTVVSYVQIHHFLPLDQNYLARKKAVRKALFQAGFTYPWITMDTEPENNIRHIIFECEIEESEE